MPWKLSRVGWMCNANHAPKDTASAAISSGDNSHSGMMTVTPCDRSEVADVKMIPLYASCCIMGLLYNGC